MSELMGEMHRSCYCGEPNDTMLGEKITLFGWVDSRRNLGSLIFIRLRDRSGVMQCVFD